MFCDAYIYIYIYISPDSYCDLFYGNCLFPTQSRQLFAFLYRLGTTPGNDANLSQLVFIFAPLLCRLPNSTYMSVRHMEDLRRLRPVLQVVLEHHAELFQEATPGPSSTVTSTAPKDVAIDAKMASQGPPSASRSMGAGTTATGRMGVRKNLFIDLSGAANAGNDAADILAPISYISPPMSAGALGVSLSSGSGSSSGESDVNDVDFAQLNPHMHRAVNFQSKEWEVCSHNTIGFHIIRINNIYVQYYFLL